MSTNIDYFGDFISSIVISEDRLPYIKAVGVEIISEQPHEGIPLKNAEKLFYITFKVSNMTFLHFMSAGIKYSMDKYYKP
jgi:hypothetical protein